MFPLPLKKGWKKSMESLNKMKTKSTQDSMSLMPEEFPVFSIKKRMSSKRCCQLCGKDPYPNYFFCPSCHHRVDDFEEYDI